MSIFVNPVEGRIRSGWRLLLQLVVMIVLFVVVGLPVSYLPLEGPETGVLAGLIAIPLSVWIAARAFDRRPSPPDFKGTENKRSSLPGVQLLENPTNFCINLRIHGLSA